VFTQPSATPADVSLAKDRANAIAVSINPSSGRTVTLATDNEGLILPNTCPVYTLIRPQGGVTVVVGPGVVAQPVITNTAFLKLPFLGTATNWPSDLTKAFSSTSATTWPKLNKVPLGTSTGNLTFTFTNKSLTTPPPGTTNFKLPSTLAPPVTGVYLLVRSSSTGVISNQADSLARLASLRTFLAAQLPSQLATDVQSAALIPVPPAAQPQTYGSDFNTEIVLFVVKQ
jgi:hypothetical protein